MRKAFTFIECMIVIAIIIAIIAAIAIPSMMHRNWPNPGEYRMWHNHRVYVTARDQETYPVTFIVRTEDNREIHVSGDELTTDTSVEKP